MEGYWYIDWPDAVKMSKFSTWTNANNIPEVLWTNHRTQLLFSYPAYFLVSLWSESSGQHLYASEDGETEIGRPWHNTTQERTRLCDSWTTSGACLREGGYGERPSGKVKEHHKLSNLVKCRCASEIQSPPHANKFNIFFAKGHPCR